MFCVYGRSRVLAKKQMNKLICKGDGEVSCNLRKLKDDSQSAKQEVIDKCSNEYFINMKVKRCTHEFSTPEIAYEALKLMLNDKNNFTDCEVMKKINKLTADLKVLVSKSTGKPLMKWVPINEEVI